MVISGRILNPNIWVLNRNKLLKIIGWVCRLLFSRLARFQSLDRIKETHRVNLGYLCRQLTQFYFLPVEKQFNSKPNLDIKHVGQMSSGVKYTHTGQVGFWCFPLLLELLLYLSQKFLIIYRRRLSENKVLTICTTGLRPNKAGRVLFFFLLLHCCCSNESIPLK